MKLAIYKNYEVSEKTPDGSYQTQELKDKQGRNADQHKVPVNRIIPVLNYWLVQP